MGGADRRGRQGRAAVLRIGLPGGCGRGADGGSRLGSVPSADRSSRDQWSLPCRSYRRHRGGGRGGALRPGGYEEIEANGYLDGDERSAYLAKVRHVNGSEVVVDVATDESEADGSILTLHSYDEMSDSAEQRQPRTGVVLEALRAEKLACESPATVSEQPDQRRRCGWII